MAVNCNDLIHDLNPGCAALNKVAGLNKRFWVVSKGNISTSTDGAGYVNTVSMANIGSIASKLYKFITKKDKISATWAVSAGENINTFNHTLIAPLYSANPTEQLAIENLVNSDDLVVFVQENANTIRILGLENGLNGSAGEGGSGILLNDANGYTVTLSGEQTTMPHYFSINGATATIAQNIAYLDALSA